MKKFIGLVLVSFSLVSAGCSGSTESLMDYCVKQGRALSKEVGYEVKNLKEECQKSFDDGQFSNKAEVDAWVKVAREFYKALGSSPVVVPSTSVPVTPVCDSDEVWQEVLEEWYALVYSSNNPYHSFEEWATANGKPWSEETACM